ncbi:MAG: MBL fold metallo-hydrolase, partial [Sediminibacterium sp.]
MKISFHGAARTVTGSKHLLTLKSGKKILLDCGLFQGMGKNTEELNAKFGFEPAEISYLILSHAHIDH